VTELTIVEPEHVLHKWLQEIVKFFKRWLARTRKNNDKECLLLQISNRTVIVLYGEVKGTYRVL
jgi:hypothetical protein